MAAIQWQENTLDRLQGIKMWGTAISYRLWCFIKSCCVQEEDTRGGVQGSAGAVKLDGSIRSPFIFLDSIYMNDKQRKATKRWW